MRIFGIFGALTSDIFAVKDDAGDYAADYWDAGWMVSMHVAAKVACHRTPTYTTPSTIGNVCELAPVGFSHTARSSPEPHELLSNEPMSSSDAGERSMTARVMRCIASLPFSTTRSRLPCGCLVRWSLTCEGSFMAGRDQVVHRVKGLLTTTMSLLPCSLQPAASILSVLPVRDGNAAEQ